MKKYTFRIKRFDPERGLEGWGEFGLVMEPSERVLDGLIRIKDELDGTLTFRRSCAHGICGSCAVKVNGRNRLACQTLMGDLPETVVLEPLPAFSVIKDLVVDFGPFFRKNEEVLPCLINNEVPPERERLQSPEEQERILQSITCIMCGSCTSACPVHWADREYLGPAALLKAFRFILDSRDRAQAERLRRISREDGVWRCHSIFNCVEVCPKEIDITAHLTQLKRLALFRRFRRNG
jgi:succinate dehydrogenase / fumarate reductase iron-sulfur subunit